ncbi:VanZ family protein [Chryseobacterium fistulae]|uniref:VanZ-like domain-containing protein n=1 Tax=Chryseobacterium fistulae TaxID=2675058 RepID=A0A6N4XS61_9FLAO|nr:VanZ family protein [Chryseobacterium fistulae]CAA7391687.1 hypothetical protein CHRY9393_02957 [Chryseobacterium fistulae]
MKKYFAVFILFYTITILYMMFFGSDRKSSDICYFQIIPFNTIHYFFADHTIQAKKFIINIIGNIFVFSPYGWLGLYIKKFNSITPITFIFLLFITFIEICQSITGRGVADVDDIILNTTGMIIGFYTFKFFKLYNIFNLQVYSDFESTKSDLQSF